MVRFVVAIAASVALAGPAFAAPSFLNDIVPLFTKAGCNQGSCHGKGVGQNGFRLSLRGFAPDQDYRSLTREFDGRRIFPSNPERSLLLLKATAQAPHEGGRLFAVDSQEYRLLLNWLQAGSPGPDAKEPKVAKLELFPKTGSLKPGEAVQLVATATFGDGAKRDVTWLTKFDSNDEAYLAVAADGKVKALRHGASAIRSMYQVEVAVAAFTMPFERTVDARRFGAKNNFIDEHVFAKLRELRIEPSDGCTDAEFLRRASLDACGVLPTPAEVHTFLADTDPKKREKLVDALLARPEFNDYWALQLGNLFQNRKERDHDVRGVKGVRQFHVWLREQVAANRPWDALARDVLTAAGPNTKNPAVGYFIVTIDEQPPAENSEVGESVAQAFLGTRIGCARCLNHPLERYTQDDFYHFAAYFSRVKFDRKDPKNGQPTILSVGHPDQNQNKNPVGVTQPRTGQFMKAQPLDRSRVDAAPNADPRAALARWITDPASEFFAGAMVNRIWKHYMNVGLVEPVDDLRATNPPTNPALWAALKKEFVDSRYDLRRLMKAILNSRAYQLASATRPGNEADARFYSHYYARRLPAEVLLDAVCEATGVPEKFDGYPLGIRAVQVPDPGAASYFLATFGRSARVTACACERNDDVNLTQLLHLQCGTIVTAKLPDKNGWLAKNLAAEKDDGKLLAALFLRTYGRPPTDAERAAVVKLLKTAPRDELFRDVFWALLNSKEFLFNE